AREPRGGGASVASEGEGRAGPSPWWPGGARRPWTEELRTDSVQRPGRGGGTGAAAPQAKGALSDRAGGGKWNGDHDACQGHSARCLQSSRSSQQSQTSSSSKGP